MSSLEKAKKKRAAQSVIKAPRSNPGRKKSAGQGLFVTHRMNAGSGGDQKSQRRHVPADLIADRSIDDSQHESVRKTASRKAGAPVSDDHGTFVAQNSDVIGATGLSGRKKSASLKRSENQVAIARSGGGQAVSVTHDAHASTNYSTNLMVSETHRTDVRSGGGQAFDVTHVAPASTNHSADRHIFVNRNVHVGSDGGVKTAIGLIVAKHREYRGLQQAKGDMERRIKGEGRWVAVQRLKMAGETINIDKFPDVKDEDTEIVRAMRPRYFTLLRESEKLCKECLDEILPLVRALPVVKFAEDTRGFALPSLAAILAHAGDLSNYSTVAKLWKRFSLHTVDGRAARKSKTDHERQQFVPKRRAEMHVIGENLVRSGGAYADLYRTRKAFEIEKANAAGLTVRPAARIPKAKADEFISEGLIHKRSLRYIEKRLLRKLWEAWRGTTQGLETTLSLSHVMLAAD